MKAGIVQNMFVARALKELGLMDVPMTLTFSPDEELGSPSTTPILGEQLNGAQAVDLYRTGLSRRRGDAGT